MYYANYSIGNFFTFLFKRLLRLEPTYIISIFTALLFIFLRNNFYVSDESQSVSVNQVLAHFGYLIPFQSTYGWLNAVYWTLAIEFQFYIFIALIVLVLNLNKAPLRYLVYLLCLLSTFLGSDQFLPFWLPFFLFGIITYLFKTNQIFKLEFIIVLITTSVLIYFRYPSAMLVYSFIPIIGIVFFESTKIVILNGIGKFSYSLYLFHSIIGSAFVNVLSHYCSGGLQKLLIILGGMVISIGSAYLIYLVVEKPSRSWSSSFTYE